MLTFTTRWDTKKQEKEKIYKKKKVERPSKKRIRRKKNIERWSCSETALPGNPSSKVWVPPLGHELLSPVAGSKQLDHWTSEIWCKCEKCRSSTGLPPPPLVMGMEELGQEWRLKQPVAKVRGPIVAGDQGSRWGPHCSETVPTGNPSS
jgi:hypothetical protein